jgi:hypothetical protein
MLGPRPAKHQNIVEENENKFLNEQPQHLIHK